jgi:hypothetical protein
MATEIVSGQRGLVNMPSDIAQPPPRDRESAAEKSSGADKPPGCRERALAAPSLSRAHHSMILVAAGAFGFLTLIQSGDRPERYGIARRFATMPFQQRMSNLTPLNPS